MGEGERVESMVYQPRNSAARGDVAIHLGSAFLSSVSKCWTKSALLGLSDFSASMWTWVTVGDRTSGFTTSTKEQSKSGKVKQFSDCGLEGDRMKALVGI